MNLEKAKPPLFYGGMLGDALLATPAGHNVTQTLAGWINTPNSTIYDKAIDSVYLETHLGGSKLHHLIDGQHDLWGAFRAAQEAMPDDSLWSEVCGTAQHLGKDLFSTMGLPAFSINPENYKASSTWISDHLGISKNWQADFLQINGLELLGGFISIATVIVGYNQADIGKLSELAGASGLGAMIGANPITLALSALALVLAWKEIRNPHNDHSVSTGAKHLAIGATTAATALTTGSALAALGLSGGLIPTVSCLLLSIMMGLFIRKFLTRFLFSSKKETIKTKQVLEKNSKLHTPEHLKIYDPKDFDISAILKEQELPEIINRYEWMQVARQAKRDLPCFMSDTVKDQLQSVLGKLNPPNTFPLPNIYDS